MPQDIKANYKSDGWDVIEINGHDYKEIFEAIKYSIQKKEPVAIIANTVMGKGVSFMENKEEFHGKALNEEQLDEALKELGLENDLEKYKKIRNSQDHTKKYREIKIPEIKIKNRKRKLYPVDKLTDNRSAYGNALIDLAENNDIKFSVFDCDLAGSVKTAGFSKVRPDEFFQGGIQEHNTATIAGAISTMPILTFFSDFGIFGVDEVYNQQRLNDINLTNLKLVCTHIGLNVGEDGKTHQCIDYIGLLSNLYNFKIIIPADPNQTDEVVKYIAKEKGNFFVGMGRSKTPVITNEAGEIYFNEDYKFEYGKMDIIRKGDNITLISMGPLLIEAIKAFDILKNEGILVNVVNCSCPTEIDSDFLKSLNSQVIITIEDHNVNTGLGSKIADVLIKENLSSKLIKLGVTSYSYSGKPEELYKIYGLDSESIVKKIKDIIN